MFTKLPAPPSASPPELPSGTVRLFRDDNWSSTFLELTTGKYRDRARHSIAGTNMQDGATYVAFNLPVATVVTLMDNDVAPKAGAPVMDLGQCGRCIDLVGTGQTEAVDLTKVNMNDCVSSFFWRTVDLRRIRARARRRRAHDSGQSALAGWLTRRTSGARASCLIAMTFPA
ncbi:MAG: hypothetical protein EOP82_18910 [Variovorax sp.]|nr:MAG: hypothetical protein EOP82_18910 [Variovorax sp.]